MLHGDHCVPSMKLVNERFHAFPAVFSSHLNRPDKSADCQRPQKQRRTKERITKENRQKGTGRKRVKQNKSRNNLSLIQI